MYSCLLLSFRVKVVSWLSPKKQQDFLDNYVAWLSLDAQGPLGKVTSQVLSQCRVEIFSPTFRNAWDILSFYLCGCSGLLQLRIFYDSVTPNRKFFSIRSVATVEYPIPKCAGKAWEVSFFISGLLDTLGWMWFCFFFVFCQCPALLCHLNASCRGETASQQHLQFWTIWVGGKYFLLT